MSRWWQTLNLFYSVYNNKKQSQAGTYPSVQSQAFAAEVTPTALILRISERMFVSLSQIPNAV